MKKSLLAGLFLTCALVLGGCSKNLGKEITFEKFQEISEEMDYADPETITAKGFSEENGTKTEVDWTVNAENYKEPKSLIIMEIFDIYCMDYVFYVYDKVLEAKGEGKFYQDNEKLGFFGKVEGKDGDISVKIEGRYQYDGHGNPIYVSETQVMSGEKNANIKVGIELSYTYK